ncbi:MAG: hypothetical protein RMJ48_14840 [Roseiflexaceae bacterium]|nr:hypothetical protein [Roseiflexaceae bacterium]
MSHLELSLPITTSPFAALLAAFGVAKWLQATGKQAKGDEPRIEVCNSGDRIIVRALEPLTPEILARAYPGSLAQWILTAKNGPAPSELSIFDYEAERKRNTEYFARRDELRKRNLRLEDLPDEQRYEIEKLEPRAEWYVAVLINQMGALAAYNKAVERWHACSRIYADLVPVILTMCDGQPGAIERAQEAWERLAKKHGLEKNADLTATQIVNPEQGKGANRAKADGLNNTNQQGFWLLEYFKFVGLYVAALPRTVRGKKDRKTYVVIPSRQGLLLRWHERVFAEFQRTFYPSSAIKMDILASLRYTKTMIAAWQAAQESQNVHRRRPSDFVEGLAVASFKDLGSAFAVMNVATIGLPEWVRWPEFAEEAQQITQALEEHERIVAAIGIHKNEDKPTGEEEQLLRDYRDFLSDRDPSLQAFFRFTTAYAGYVLREQARRFSTNNLEVIIMAQETERPKEFLPLVRTPGFRRIASAIRQSTVTLQYLYSTKDFSSKAKVYDIRYGLADELHRHSRDNADFLRALSKFLWEYNQENARVLERFGENIPLRRVHISYEDIEQVTELVDQYGAPTVASLLIAFGYAREPGRKDGKPLSEEASMLEDEGDTSETITEDASNPDEPF